MAGSLVEHCTHPQARHVHGTHTAYVLDRCRCDECRAAAMRSVKQWKLDVREGRARMVPAEVVRAHLERLRAAGMSIMDIARVSGMSRTSVTKALYPGRRMMRKCVAERWLALRPPQSPSGRGYVPVLGSSRRLQALGALGWSQSVLAGRLGWERGQVQRVAAARMRQVRGDTAADVLRVWEQLGSTPATGADAERVRRLARSRGWLPPLAWPDDADLDDPQTEPLPRFVWDPTMPQTSRRRAERAWLSSHSAQQAAALGLEVAA